MAIYYIYDPSSILFTIETLSTLKDTWYVLPFSLLLISRTSHEKQRLRVQKDLPLSLLSIISPTFFSRQPRFLTALLVDRLRFWLMVNNVLDVFISPFLPHVLFFKVFLSRKVFPWYSVVLRLRRVESFEFGYEVAYYHSLGNTFFCEWEAILTNVWSATFLFCHSRCEGASIEEVLGGIIC